MSFVGFSDESMMTSIPWDDIEDWFDLRAIAAGHSKYSHSETFDLSGALDPEMERVAHELSYNLGREISRLFEEIK